MGKQDVAATRPARQAPRCASSDRAAEPRSARSNGGPRSAGDFGVPRPLLRSAACRTGLGALIVGDCLDVLGGIPNETFDLVLTSPPYDGQPKYGNAERYERRWYQGFFLEVAAEILRTLKPHGSFVLNYRSNSPPQKSP